jgi:hypothetical protein
MKRRVERSCRLFGDLLAARQHFEQLWAHPQGSAAGGRVESRELAFAPPLAHHVLEPGHLEQRRPHGITGLLGRVIGVEPHVDRHAGAHQFGFAKDRSILAHRRDVGVGGERLFLGSFAIRGRTLVFVGRRRLHRGARTRTSGRWDRRLLAAAQRERAPSQRRQPGRLPPARHHLGSSGGGSS